MKITETPKSLPGIPAPQTSAARSAGKTAINPAASDSVSLSSQAQALAASAVRGNVVFDAKKIERIKLAIASGQFHVDSEKIADGLLETVKDLLHSPQR